MSRLIDADTLLKELESNKLQPTKDTDGFIDGWCEGFNTVVDMIRNQPISCDVEKVQKNMAIDEAIKASANAICVGCGYLKEFKCTYKGGNCGVSKPMLESVVKALEQLKNQTEC